MWASNPIPATFTNGWLLTEQESINLIMLLLNCFNALMKSLLILKWYAKPLPEPIGIIASATFVPIKAFEHSLTVPSPPTATTMS